MALRIRIIAVGRIKGAEKELAAAWLGRLPWPVETIEIDDRRSGNDPRHVDVEGERLIAAVPEGSTVVILDENGRTLSSTAFAKQISRWQDDGVRDLSFIIGGADGTSAAVRQRGDLVLSLGTMTWPHFLVRTMLAEQLYRAGTILAGHPYHRT